VHCVPGEGGAFDADGKVADSGENLKVAEVVGGGLLVQFASHHLVEFIKQLFSLLLILPLHRLSHHAGSGLGDGATGAFKADVLNRVLFKKQIDGQLIPAEWVEAFRRMIGRVELAKVSRLLVVVKNDLLVEFAKFGHGSRIQETEFRIQKTEFRIQKREDRIQK